MTVGDPRSQGAARRPAPPAPKRRLPFGSIKAWRNTAIVAGALAAVIGVGASIVSLAPKLFDLSNTLQPYVIDDGDMSVELVHEYVDKTCLYKVSYPVTYKNSALLDIDVSYSIIQIDLASEPPGIGVGQSYLGGDPPLFNTERQQGPLQWKVVEALFTADSRTSSRLKAEVKQRTQADVTDLGDGLDGEDGMTGVVHPGGTTQNPYWFFVRTPPDQYIGIVMIGGLDGNASLDNDQRQVIDEDVSKPKYALLNGVLTPICDRARQ